MDKMANILMTKLNSWLPASEKKESSATTSKEGPPKDDKEDEENNEEKDDETEDKKDEHCYPKKCVIFDYTKFATRQRKWLNIIKCTQNH